MSIKKLMITKAPTVHEPELLTGKDFSEDCKAILGESNLQDYYSLSTSEEIKIFTQITNYCIDKWPNRVQAYYGNLPGKLHYGYVLPGPINSTVSWTRFGKASQGFLRLLAEMHGTTIHDEAQKVASLLGISLHHFRVPRSSQHDLPSRHDIDCAPYAPQQLIIEQELMILDSTIPFVQKAGDIHSHLCVYKSSKNKVFIIATGLLPDYEVSDYKKYYSVIGMPHEVSFLNKNVLNQNQDATVLWPMDMLVAKKLDSFIADSRTLSHQDYVAVGYYGKLVLNENLDLKTLAVRDIVLIPEISRPGMLDAVKLSNLCYKAGANSVKICTSPCLPFPPASSLEVNDLHDPWEREIVSQAIDLEAVEVLTNFFAKLEKHAMTPREFITWGEECAVFKGKNHEESDLSRNMDALDVSPVSVFPASAIEDDSASAPYDLDRLISAESRTMLYSPTEHGKSFLVLHLALAIAYGGQTSIFKATKSRKALILDGETGPQQFQERIKEVQGKYKIDQKDKDNFYFLGIKGNPRCKDFNLSTEESQQAVFDCCKAQAAEVLVFDNVATLWPKAATSTKELDRFLGFIKQVEGEGIAVIVAHHSTKDGQSIKGLSELESLFQNVIALEKPSESDHKQPPELQQYVDEKGALCKCTLTKSKMLPEVTDKAFYLHLPLHSGRWKDVTPTKEGYLADKNSEDFAPSGNATSDSNSHTVLPELSGDGQKLFDYFNQEDRDISRKEVEKLLGCKEDKARDVISKLQNAKRIDLVGGGRSTAYRLRKI